jgi:hypothetical protein
LNTEIARIITERSHRDRMVAADFEPISTTAVRFGAFIKSETEKWAKVVKNLRRAGRLAGCF